MLQLKHIRVEYKPATKAFFHETPISLQLNFVPVADAATVLSLQNINGQVAGKKMNYEACHTVCHTASQQ